MVFSSSFGYAQLSKTAEGYNVGTNEIIIFPNPARETVNLSMKNTNDLKFTYVGIYSILGNQVAEFTGLNQSMLDLRIDRMKPGRYLLKYILSDNTQKVKQLIKE